MKESRLFFCIIFLAFLSATKACARFGPDKVVELNRETGYRKNISENVLLFNDSLARFTLTDVMSGKCGNLFHANIFSQSLLKAHHPYMNLWGNFIVSNPDTVDRQFYLHFVKGDSIYIFWIQNGKLQNRLVGSLVESVNKEPYGTGITIRAGDSVQFFLNIKKDDYYPLRADFPVYISEHDALISQIGLWRLYYGIFYGIIIALILNSLIIYIGSKKEIYLYYLALLLAVLLFYLDWNKIGALYIWNKAPFHVLEKYGNNLIFSTLIIMTAFLFCRKFLDLRNHFPRLDNLLLLLAFIKLVDYLPFFNSYYDLRRFVLNYMVLFTILLIIWVSVLMAKRNSYNAKLFLCIFSIPCVSVILNQLNFIGILPGNILISNSMQTGMGLAAIGFSVAISASIRKMNAEAQQAELAVIENARINAVLSQKVSETEMKALRSQMNPHFIFNALQSIQTFLLTHKSEEANVYLLKFSKLMRLVLENSQHSEVPLKEDMQALELYMQLESIRLQHPFTYQFHIDKSVDIENDSIPPLILQPFVENAIWHGLQYKPEPGHINIFISKKANALHATVEDNGVGRDISKQVAQPMLIKKESLGMKLTEERLNILNKTKKVKAEFKISDLFSNENMPKGTRVDLLLPLIS